MVIKKIVGIYALLIGENCYLIGMNTTMASPLTAAAPPVAKTRIVSIDILRGAVMIIMALDHVRDYFSTATGDPTDLHSTTPLLFFTRWITHFCAPTFVFLSGVSAYIAGRRRTRPELGSFLMTRGAWLVLIEVSLVTLGWTFDPAYHVIIFQVIWAIGWSMIILGLLARLSPALIPFVGVLLVAGHNATDYFPHNGPAWDILLTSPPTFIGYAPHRGFFDLYAILPWTGVMLMGYSIGRWFTPDYPAEQRRKLLLRAGFAVTALFILLRFINGYGDRSPWSVQSSPLYTVLSFVNTTKYPPSLLYLCMTLGPVLILLALTEKAKGAFVSVIQVYGRVPFFYYVIHLYLIHFCCAVLFFVSGYGFKDAFDPHSPGPFLFRRSDLGFGLGGVYLVWLFVVFVLYFPSKWYDRYKRVHNKWWFSYI
ncbi:putative membrane protein [Dinghuibacter silviterrae]|uniref:Putative membrane protein n=2 Tax=Dinghuibacter silviterrae TaxID=1539049 RepID=A0A4R8DJ14_9BACT|nr:putative membrane protein [Dinghuibacter silviterrae]